jgi:hypothetical protein
MSSHSKGKRLSKQADRRDRTPDGGDLFETSPTRKVGTLPAFARQRLSILAGTPRAFAKALVEPANSAQQKPIRD